MKETDIILILLVLYTMQILLLMLAIQYYFEQKRKFVDWLQNRVKENTNAA